MLKVLEDRIRSQNDELPRDLDELGLEAARRMLAVALELEVERYLAKYADFRDECGHTLVVGNGRARPRKVTVG